MGHILHAVITEWFAVFFLAFIFLIAGYMVCWLVLRLLVCLFVVLSVYLIVCALITAHTFLDKKSPMQLLVY